MYRKLYTWLLKRRKVLVALVWLAYLPGFLGMYTLVGREAPGLSTLPILITAGVTGVFGGVLAALLSFPLNVALLNLVGEPGWEIMVRGGLLGTLVMVVIGALVGRMYELGRRLNRELEARRATELTLRESEVRFRALFEHSPHPVLLLTTEMPLTILESNPATTRLYGYSQEELSGMPVANLDSDREGDKISRRREALLRTGEFAFDDTHLTKGGSELFVEVRANIVTLEGQQFILASHHDVSERVRVKQEIRRREAILKAVSFAAERFLRAPTTLDQNISNVLKRLGEAAGVSRVYVFENYTTADGTLLASQRYEWVAPGIPPQIDNPELQALPFREAGFSRWADALQRSQPIHGHVRDFPKSERDLLAAQAISSLVVVPIFVGAEWWGFLGFDSCSQERQWSHTEIEALSAAADTLGATIQRKQTEEALRLGNEKLTALYKSSLDLIVPHDLSQLLQIITKRATDLLRGSGGGLYLCNPERREVRCVVSYNTARDYEDTILQYGQGAAGVVAETGKSLIVEDYSAWSHRAEAFEGDRSFTSIISVPMLWQGQVTGVIHVLHGDEAYFTDEHLELLTLFANQAALAVKNARLLESEREQRQLAEAMRLAGRTLSARLDTDTVLDQLLDQVARLVPYDSANIMRIKGDYAQVVRAQGYSDFYPENAGLVEGAKFYLPETPNLKSVVASGAPFVIPDVREYDVWHKLETSKHIRSWVGAPIKLSGEVVALFSLDKTEPGFYQPHHLELLTLFAEQASLAFHNASLFEEVQRLALTDELTGIANRRQIFQMGQWEFNRAKRFERTLAAIMFDLDHFKRVNDKHGHAVGDKVLQVVAQRCSENVREIDILARYGGEEFVVLLSETCLADAAKTAERLRQAVAGQAIETSAGSLPITISLGVASTEVKTRDLSDLLRRADAALYAAKQAGRNRVYCEA